MERIQNKNGINNNINSLIPTKFEKPNPSKYYVEYNWKSLNDKINLSSQHLNVKSLNLELLIKHGPNAWKKYLNRLDTIAFEYDLQVKSLENDNLEVNKQRKFIQMETLNELNQLENKYKYHLDNCFNVEKECIRLKYRLRKLKKSKKEKIDKILKINKK